MIQRTPLMLRNGTPKKKNEVKGKGKVNRKIYFLFFVFYLLFLILLFLFVKSIYAVCFSFPIHRSSLQLLRLLLFSFLFFLFPSSLSLFGVSVHFPPLMDVKQKKKDARYAIREEREIDRKRRSGEEEERTLLKQ